MESWFERKLNQTTLILSLPIAIKLIGFYCFDRKHTDIIDALFNVSVIFKLSCNQVLDQ